MNESTQWPPLCKIDGLDPYPWHGLVYRVSGEQFIQYLDPMDARPVVVLPAPPYLPATAHGYFPRLNGVLWDIGHPDPPQPPLMLAGSGRSIGRRGVNPGGQMPARLGGKTYQVEVRGYPTPAGLELSLAVGGESAPIFTTLTLANFGISLSALYFEDSSSALSDFGAFELSLRFCDAAPDGARRLFSVQLNRVGNPEPLFENVPVGFFEVLLSVVEGQPVTAIAAVVRQVHECLGTYTRGGSVAYLRKHTVASAPCTRVYELQPMPPSEAPAQPDAGAASYTEARTGLVTGALYVPGGIGYFTCDKSRSETRTGTWSNPGYAGTATEHNGDITCDYTGIDLTPPSEITRTLDIHESLTAHFGAGSISAVYDYAASSAGTDQGGLIGTESSTLMGNSASGPPISASIPLYWPYLGSPPGPLVMPALGTFALNSGATNRTARLARAGSFQGICASFTPAADGAQSGVLHATGVTGAQTAITPIRRDTFTGDPLYDAALCPITRAAIRACDLSGGKIIIGWL